MLAKSDADGPDKREVVVMPNEENLIPFSERTESEQREIQQKGGIASGQARRRKRRMKDAAEYYLSLPVSDRRKFNRLARRYVDAEEIDNQMLLVAGLHDAACAGDARAATVLIKLLGEETPENSDEGEVRIVDDL